MPLSTLFGNQIDLNLSRSVIERLKEAVKFRKVQEVKAKSYFKHRAYRYSSGSSYWGQRGV